MNPLTNSKPERYLNVCFQIHQPRRLPPHGFSVSNDVDADDDLNSDNIRKAARNCYQPVNLMLLRLIHKLPKLRITFSISGVALEQLERYCPAVIESFRMLASTDSVEFLGEAYNHSLCSLIDTQEFTHQVNKHTEAMERLLGVKPKVFRNTESIYSDRLGNLIQQLGFKGIYIDDHDRKLNEKTLNSLYRQPHASDFKLFLRDHRLNDDFAFQLSDKRSQEYPPTVQKCMSWLEQQKPFNDNLINLGMDYEIFENHKKNETGVLRFMEAFLTTVACSKTINMINPTETIKGHSSKEPISVPKHISWTDRERDLSTLLGADKQRDAFDCVNKLNRDVVNGNDDSYISTWRYLHTSDHFYNMSTKSGDDGIVHWLFNEKQIKEQQSILNTMCEN